MNYYSHHIGDYTTATAHLSILEDGAYRRLMDRYYTTETSLPSDELSLFRVLRARTEDEKEAVRLVLAEFFVSTDAGWIHKRCDAEIAAFKAKSGKAADAANKRWNKPSDTPAMPAPNVDAIPTQCERIADAMPTTNQEPITNNHRTATASSSDDDVRQCPTGTLIDLYHELMPLNPRVKTLNSARKGTIKARWLEAAKLDCAPFGYTTKSAGLDAWRKFFDTCANSTFLTGQSQASPGKPPFVADIDFLFSPSGFAKILENKYHRDAT